MLNLLDESIEHFLRTIVPLPDRDVDVSFDAPDSDWGTGITKPTINLYLWDVRRHIQQAQSGLELVEQEDGTKVRQPPKPRVDVRYLISAWTAETRDEHALLGGVLAALLPRTEIPAEHLQGAYASVRPIPSLAVAAAGEGDKSDFWSALGGQLKPGLDLMVTATVDSFLSAEAGPPVERYRIDLAAKDNPEGSTSSITVVGGNVDAGAVGEGALLTSRRGRTTVDADGSFRLRAETGDELVLEHDPLWFGEVPESGLATLAPASTAGKRKATPKKTGRKRTSKRTASD